MNTKTLYGYNGKILRVNLSRGAFESQKLEEDILKKYVGGAALGIKLIYDEVSPYIDAFDPRNHLFIGSGPLGASAVGGSGSICVVTKGALTNGIASTQANGLFGAFLRLSGFDGIILSGSSPSWVYLYIHDGIAEIKDASHLVGKDTYEVDRILKQELQREKKPLSVLCIGPAGENLVRFAAIFTDIGHVAAHNGTGAVMGSKKLKAIVVERGDNPFPFNDAKRLSELAREIRENTINGRWGLPQKEGTVGGVVMGAEMGTLPVKNYLTSVNPFDPEKLETYSWKSITSRFKSKPKRCWACSANHCSMMEISEGKYKGREVEEPEYELMAAFSCLVGIDDVTTTIVLASEVDRLGMDGNETGWIMAWLMECYEKGILTKENLDGIEMRWGNDEAIMSMLHKISKREGIGNILAEGIMRASRQVGGEAKKIAIYTKKGNTPRGHDHRVMWLEMFDTCVSNTGTLEAHIAAPLKLLGLPEKYDPFDPIVISTMDAKIKGAMIFEDSLVTCRFNTSTALDLLCEAVNASTGWNMNIEEAMKVGRRAVNLARIFNLRAGIGSELDAPSERYGSTPKDGIGAGKSIMAHWDKMLKNYYSLMGWDEKGRPLPETLKNLEIDFAIQDLPE